jgi:hypothetical protein
VYEDDGVHNYLLQFTRGTTPGSGAVTMVIANPVSGSDIMRLDAPPGCDLLHVSADFDVALPVPIPIDGPFVIDWSRVTHSADGEGHAWTADTATIWRVSNMFGDFVAHVLELDALATEIWDVPLDGKRADLALARSRSDGRAFERFLLGDYWLLGLICTSFGTLPMPPVLSVVEPVAR